MRFKLQASSNIFVYPFPSAAWQDLEDMNERLRPARRNENVEFGACHCIQLKQR